MPRTATLQRLPFLALCAVALACDSPAAPADLEPQFAKPGTTTDTDPRAAWAFQLVLSDGATEARITGDGRAADGSGVGAGEASTYQGDVCGVHAKIFVENGGGDAVLDPDGGSRKSYCGAARYLAFDLGTAGVATDAPFTNAFGAWHLAPGEVRTQDQWITNANVAGCERLGFRVQDGSGVVVTRVDDGTGARQWTVESTGTHEAGCFTWSKGAYVPTGTTYYLPFSVVMTAI